MRVVEREVVIPWKVELAIPGRHSSTGSFRKGDEKDYQRGDSHTRHMISATKATGMAMQLRVLVLSLVREIRYELSLNEEGEAPFRRRAALFHRGTPCGQAKPDSSARCRDRG